MFYVVIPSERSDFLRDEGSALAVVLRRRSERRLRARIPLRCCACCRRRHSCFVSPARFYLRLAISTNCSCHPEASGVQRVEGPLFVCSVRRDLATHSLDAYPSLAFCAIGLGSRSAVEGFAFSLAVVLRRHSERRLRAKNPSSCADVDADVRACSARHCVSPARRVRKKKPAAQRPPVQNIALRNRVTCATVPRSPATSSRADPAAGCHPSTKTPR